MMGFKTQSLNFAYSRKWTDFPIPTKQKEIMLIPRHELYGNLRLHETLNSAVFQLSVWLLVTLIAYND